MVFSQYSKCDKFIFIGKPLKIIQVGTNGKKSDLENNKVVKTKIYAKELPFS